MAASSQYEAQLQEACRLVSETAGPQRMAFGVSKPQRTALCSHGLVRTFGDTLRELHAERSA